MYTAVLVFHIIVVVGLIGVILVQRGRSGGLVEALGGVESIFGTKTSSFFVRLTVILVVLFFLTSIFLAYLSKEKGKSLMERYQPEPLKSQTEQELESKPDKPLEQPKEFPSQKAPLEDEEE